jgi:hypothetical protein
MSDYYKFGDVQVLDISRHLTSNAGQALQYIARSSRLDGNNKGDTAGDLQKAIDFLRDELKRIGSDPGDGERGSMYSHEEITEMLDKHSLGHEITEPRGPIWEKITEKLWASGDLRLSSHYLADRLMEYVKYD